MNVVFHTTTSIGISVLLTNNSQYISFKKYALAFLFGIVSHGLLDYIPHCYPINSKLDVIISLVTISIIFFVIKNQYRFMIVISFIGSIFPDLIDLLPSIVNKHLGFALPTFDKIFPWHWQQYSGSIYSNNCNLSMINHSIILFTFLGICLIKKSVMLDYFK